MVSEGDTTCRKAFSPRDAEKKCATAPAANGDHVHTAEAVSPTDPISEAPFTAAATAVTHAHRLAAFNEGSRLRRPGSSATAPAPQGSSPGDSASNGRSYQFLDAEDDEGDVEYKWRLTSITDARFENLVTQMQFRVSEGCGQCLYELGVADNGTPRGLPPAEYAESVETIQRMARRLQFDCAVLQEHQVSAAAGEPLYCAELLVSRRQARAQDIRLYFFGTAGSGKSTLMGALLTERLDDGKGSTRQLLFNHKHELDTGRTTSISTRVWSVSCAAECTGELDYGSCQDRVAAAGAAVTSPFRDADVAAGSPVASPAASRSEPRLISLMDAGGDITKTSLFGLMSRQPDYVCVCVAADSPAAAEGVCLYAQLCLAMATPFIVVVTKSDAVEEFELDGFSMDVSAALVNIGCTCETPETEEAAMECCRSWLLSGRPPQPQDGCEAAAPTPPRVPLFCVSSVTGEGLGLLRFALSHLRRPPRLASPVAESPSCEVLLDAAFDVRGVGPVVSGLVTAGTVSVGSQVLLGPDDAGAFAPVSVRGIHVDGAHVNEAHLGDEATFALDAVPALLDVGLKGKMLASHPPPVCAEFLLSVHVLAQSLAPSVEPILYTRNTRQAVRVVSTTPLGSTGGGCLAAGQDGGGVGMEVECRFLFRPEGLLRDAPVVLRWEPHGIAIGRVSRLGPSA